MESKKLNLGCGTKIKAGWINLDIAPGSGIDVVHDIEKLPLPFKNGEFEEVLCEDILEHVEYIPVLRDIHRILKNGGSAMIRVPHFTSKTNFIDPTHKKRFSIETFDFFVSGTKRYRKRPYYFDFAFEHCREVKIDFEYGSPEFFLNPTVERIVNRSSRMQKLYESTFLSRIFPANNIYIVLVK